MNYWWLNEQTLLRPAIQKNMALFKTGTEMVIDDTTMPVVKACGLV